MGSSAFAKYPSNYDFQGKKVLNLGCGFAQFSASNVVNLDGEPASNANVIWDLSKTPLPFEDETFDMVFANHILEHVPNWWKCFEDCSRILKTGGQLEVWVPGPGNDSVLGFRDHINTINLCSFWGIHGFYRNPGNAWAAAHAQGPATRLGLVNVTYKVDSKRWWIRWAPVPLRNWMADHLRNVVYEIGFIFKKIEPAGEEPEFNPAVLEAMI